jgi:hypothetical protein
MGMSLCFRGGSQGAKAEFVGTWLSLTAWVNLVCRIFAAAKMTHLSEDETFAKMGHPDLWLVRDVGHPPTRPMKFF